MGYITLKQAAELWNISERRIRRLIQENRIDGAVKIGNAWSIPEENLWIKDIKWKKIDLLLMFQVIFLKS